MTKKKSVAFFERSSWYHRYKIVNDDGTIKYAKKGGFSTQEEAEESYKKYLEEYQNKIRNYQITVDKNVNFSDYLKYWFENIYSLRVEDTTKIVGSYIIYDLIIPNIDYDVKLNLITTDYLNNLIETAYKITPSGGYSSRSYIYMALKDAVINGYLTNNPCEKTKVYRRPKPKITIYNKEELKKFLIEASKTNWYLEVLLGLFCGLRKAEIMGLKFSDYDVENNILSINRQITVQRKLKKESCESIESVQIAKHLKTVNSKRVLKVPSIVVEEINKRKEFNNKLKEKNKDIFVDEDYISCQINGKPKNLSSMNGAVCKIANRANLKKISVHGLRHMFATILIEQGVSLPKISAVLGHSSVHTTFEYYCEIMDEQEKILAFINDQFAVVGEEE